MTKANDYIKALNDAIDARAQFEAGKNKDASSNIAKTLADIRKSVSHERIASIMLASNIDANFINRAQRADSRMNVYAVEKVVNVARAIAKVETLNHYSRFILQTAKVFAENKLQMNNDDAKSACSLEVKVKETKREKLIVKYQKHVSFSTANAQSSSSLDALCMFNVLTKSKDEANKDVYIFNADNENAKTLLAQL